jgi:molybdopterin-guanine dinucleotide biosynthesis protein
MRIAISGSHRTGKSTLVEKLSALLPEHAAVDVPYPRMAEDGYDFCQPPSLDDFEAQLERRVRTAMQRMSRGNR